MADKREEQSEEETIAAERMCLPSDLSSSDIVAPLLESFGLYLVQIKSAGNHVSAK